VAYELSKAAKDRARKAFRLALEAAVPAYEIGQMRLFHDDDEAHMRREVERKLFKPKLPNAGEQERKWVQRLREMSYASFWDTRETFAAWSNGEEKRNIKWLCARAAAAAKQWALLLPREQYDQRHRPNPGRYYFLHPLTPKNDSIGFKWLCELESAAKITKEWDVKWFARLLLDGQPEGCSDFYLEAICGLERWNGDVLRIVRLRNIRGEQKNLLVLPADEFKSPEVFREWGLRQGSFSSGMNQTHLQMMHEDVGCQIAWRIMKEIDACGWYQLPYQCRDEKAHAYDAGVCKRCGMAQGVLNGLWLYDDCAYHNGACLKADEDNIYWVNEAGQEQGYFLSEKGRESEFALGRPAMHPGVALADLFTLKEVEAWENKPAPRPLAEQKADGKTTNPVALKYDEMELLRTFFREVCQKFNETQGTLASHMAVGAMFGYAAAPEIFQARGELPGLWIHGQMESGKTKFTEWLTYLCGFSRQAGVSSIKSTTVGILQEAQNYSNLPLWVDEFRQSEVGLDKLSLIRDSYNRQPQLKWSPDGVQRKIRTAFMVSGESTSTDAATRSRFPHVQISELGRLKNHFDWFTAHKKQFFVFWRHVMVHRAQFVKLVMAYLKAWLTDPNLARVSEREKFVHGVSYAAWNAMVDLLNSHTAEEMGDFYHFMAEHVRQAAIDVKAETNINVFWTDVLNAFKAGAIKLSVFRLDKEVGEYPEGCAFPNYTLYCDPDALVSSVAEYLRGLGEKVSLRRTDLRDQLSKAVYWIPGQHSVRFGPKGSMSVTKAWAISLNDHPLGRQNVSLEDLSAALDTRAPGISETGLIFRDGDPRKGPLYQIIYAIEQKAHEEQQGGPTP
jgi:hypothetical protein